MSAWLSTLVTSVGASAMMAGAAFAATWALVGVWLGRSYDRRSGSVMPATAIEEPA